MESQPPGSSLQSAGKLGLIGDLCGDLGALLDLSKSMATHGVHALLALGNVGLLWACTDGAPAIAKLSRRLRAAGQTFYWVDGNHEDFGRLATFTVDADGLRRLAPNVIHLPRGYRTTLASGRTLAALGGANSIDRHLRSSKDWWPDEAITQTDLDALGDTHVDVLVGHDAPLDLLTLDRRLAETDQYWPADSLEYAQRGRDMFHRGFLHTTPGLYLGGHYHRHIDETVGYVAGDGTFASRVVLLDMVQNAQSASAAILDTDTLQLRFFTVRGVELPTEPTPVTDLTTVSGGRWMLHTVGSRHLVDLDAGTIERIPGAQSHPTTSDAVHQIRTLDVCRIGERGRWTMLGDPFGVDYYWHVSSPIRHIEPLASPGLLV